MFAACVLERRPPDRMPLFRRGQIEARIEVENSRELGAALRGASRQAVAEREQLVRGDLRVDVGAVDLARMAAEQRDRAPVVARVVCGARAVERRLRDGWSRSRGSRARAAAAHSRQEKAKKNVKRGAAFHS